MLNKERVQFFESQKKKSQFFESHLKKVSFLSHLKKKGLNSLNHVVQKGSILWVMFKKVQLFEPFFWKVQFFESDFFV